MGKSQPHAGPPPARCRASLPPAPPPGSEILRPEFSILRIPGSRGCGEEDPGKVWGRDGFGAWGEGQFSRYPILSLLGSGDPPASCWLLSALSLPWTFPGQLGLKFSGEAPRARGIRGRLGSAQDPPPEPPPGRPGWLQGASLRGEAAATVAPPSPGRVESRDLLELRVQLRREGGEGRR